MAGSSGQLSDIQRAFIDHTAFQCSHGSSGFLITAVRLAEEPSAATREEIRHHCSGNLCSCGGCVTIADAIEDVLERRLATRTPG